MMTKKSEYISLREAAALSGYSPDYVGQLIRSGKLPGKQVFANVAWMTTAEAVEEYMEGKRAKAPAKDGETVLLSIQKRLESPHLVQGLAIALIALSVAFLLLLFYVFSTALDQRLNQRAIERLEQKT